MREHRKIVVTGGAGFVGSSIAISLQRRFSGLSITCVDNLKRRGSELNLSRLRENGIAFVHADVRAPEDMAQLPDCDLVVDCSAEPSVLAGYESPLYVVNTNLSGTVNCLEFARVRSADFVLLSTSRVYPIASLNRLHFVEEETRFEIADEQPLPGVSREGISEDFPLMDGCRSLYGATKLASELLVSEYAAAYGMRTVVNRCGILTGPWQMGKVDQGVVVLWLARHVFGKPLSYIGYGGKGKQVRDMLHVEDLIDLLCTQLNAIEKHNGVVYNVGGGRENAFSLCELTSLCRRITGHTVPIGADPETRSGDLRYYVTDTRRVRSATGWQPSRNVDMALREIYQWLTQNKAVLSCTLG